MPSPRVRRSSRDPSTGRSRVSRPVPGDRELRLGTRGSQLALWQANTVAARIAEAGRTACRLVTIKTSGRPPAGRAALGGRRQTAVRQGDRGRAAPERDRPGRPQQQGHAGRSCRTAWRSRRCCRGKIRATRWCCPIRSEHIRLSRIPRATRSCASLLERWDRRPRSARAACGASRSCRGCFRMLAFLPIRGNLDTRLRKLDEGQYDALVLAAAGLRRLGFASRISLALPASACVPAPGQGIVAVEIRADDDDTRRCGGVDRRPAGRAAALTAERALVDGPRRRLSDADWRAGLAARRQKRSSSSRLSPRSTAAAPFAPSAGDA